MRRGIVGSAHRLGLPQALRAVIGYASGMAGLRSRRLVAALLWLALALLPLRGLAAGWMPAAMAAQALAAQADDTSAASHDPGAGMPCHAASTEVTPMHHAPPGGEALLPGDCPTCALCALCHGGFVDATVSSVPLAAPPGDAPDSGAPAAIEPRAPDALFRPPRARVA